MLALEDMKKFTEEKVKEELETYYSGDGVEKEEVHNFLKNAEVLVAYESTGSWGCDSSSFFLFRKGKKRPAYYTVYGSHCSCYGFEGQFVPEKVSVEYLKSKQFCPYIGGYDEDPEGNRKAIRDFMQGLPD